MTAPYVEIDPQGILIPPSLDGSGLRFEDLLEEVPMWHIIDEERALTWCGLFLTQGSDRRLFSETPEDRRCQICIERFGEDMVRDSHERLLMLHPGAPRERP